MFITVGFPWPVPSANADLVGFAPAGLKTTGAATNVPEAMPDTRAPRPEQVEELVRWSRRERLRLVWYRLRLATARIYRPSRNARELGGRARRGLAHSG